MRRLDAVHELAAAGLFTRCVDALADLGVEPSEATLQLQGRLTTP